MFTLRQFRLHFFWMGVIFLCLNCATTYQPSGRSDAKAKIQSLNTKLRSNPNDPTVLRDLGIAYYESEQYPAARKSLIKAFKLKPNDPQTLLYLGMTLEAENKTKIALKIYQRYSRIPQISPYRKALEGKYQLLSRQLIREEIQQLVQQEQQLGANELSPNAIAIFPFAYQGSDPQYAALGKGIAEMMITDLSQVRNLKLIERVRLQALIDELELDQTGLVEEETASRFGKLLRAGKIIHGNYNIQSRNKLQLELALWDMQSQAASDLLSKDDALNNLFYLEKDLVFQVISEMGIELTPAEREKVQRIPTKNMQAFLNYCMGLEHEDAGNFQAAAQSFQKAFQLDPSFSRAGEKAERSKDIASVEQGTNKLLAATDHDDNRSEQPTGNTNLINDRLQNLSFSIGSNFIPGKDTRKSMEEAATSRGGSFGDLPEPPPLPQLP
ncbi:MAG: hypothetical protein ONB27_09415, partial [candidate division KSB1 bacterium]|nr:hypothetical protein [candidate division KSB1 bacterium]